MKPISFNNSQEAEGNHLKRPGHVWKLYTYWCDDVMMGLTMTNQDNLHVTTVPRYHSGCGVLVSGYEGSDTCGCVTSRGIFHCTAAAIGWKTATTGGSFTTEIRKPFSLISAQGLDQQHSWWDEPGDRGCRVTSLAALPYICIWASQCT